MDKNPQIENGHTKIANEILESLMDAGLNGSEWNVLMHVIRKTYGWNKKSDLISITQFEKAVKSPRSVVCRTIKSLVTKKILLVTKTGLVNEYGFNKRYNQWVVTKVGLAKKTRKGSDQNNKKVVTKMGHTKDTLTKDTIINTKEKIKRKKFGEYVKLTDKEYQNFTKTYGQPYIDLLIEKVNNYAPNRRQGMYKDWAAAIRTFIMGDKNSENKEAAFSQGSDLSEIPKFNPVKV